MTKAFSHLNSVNNLFQAFIELEQLTKHGEEMEWQETARWIKFEENVEESNRWGKPHVASLTFHSLLELRKGLEKGTCTMRLSLIFYIE